MADVALDPQNSNPKELYSQGVRAYVLQDYEAAVGALSKASALLSEKHQDELHDSLGDVYLYYGKSLLELSRKESDPLGEAVLKNVEEDSDSEEIEEGEATEEANNGNADSTENGQVEQAKESEEATVDQPMTSEGEAGSSTDKKEGEEPEEELTDLQVAWEVLELAKKIFIKRGNVGKKYLSDTMIVLGEISLESGNFQSAIDDIQQGLEIQKTIYGNDSRTIAETYYKLGGALSTNGQIDESIASFQGSFDYLKKKLENLQKDDKDTNKSDEIIELNNLIPEIEDKIADMKSLKAEMTSKVTSTVTEVAEPTNGCSSTTNSSKPATDISHLVKRKRKSDEPIQDLENPAKKPSP